jgi:cell division protein FtsL
MAAGKGRQGKVRRRQTHDIGIAMWLGLVALLVVTTGSATGVIYSTHKSRHLLNDLQQLEQRRNELQVEWGQLLLEQSSLVSQGRIENVAIAELGMKIPATENVVVMSGE